MNKAEFVTGFQTVFRQYPAKEVIQLTFHFTYGKTVKKVFVQLTDM